MLFFVNTFIARYPVCNALKRTALNHRALQFHHDRRDIVPTVRLHKMNPMTDI